MDTQLQEQLDIGLSTRFVACATAGANRLEETGATGSSGGTNPTSDNGCSTWAMVGSAMATAPRQMTLYSCRGST